MCFFFSWVIDYTTDKCCQMKLIQANFINRKKTCGVGLNEDYDFSALSPQCFFRFTLFFGGAVLNF